MTMISPLTPRRVGAGVARGEPAAVDHQAIEVARLGRRLEFDRHAGGAQLLVQRRQHAARLDMAFGGEEQRIGKAAGERRLERGDFFSADALVAAREPREPFEVGSDLAHAPPPASR